MGKTTRHSVVVAINFIISDEDIDDIMAAALEGGITYWCNKAEVVGEYRGEYASEQISWGGSLKLYEAEGDEVYELTLDKFLTGLRLWIEYEHSYTLTKGGRLDVSEIDATAADAIVQYALFSDLIYG